MSSAAPFRLFVCGDVMTGRGVDQILPRPGDPRLHEDHVKNAREYVRLAEQASGQIPRAVPFAYVWGDALEELARARPDARIVNLETSITRSDEHWVGKGIHYRMHPDNAPCLTAARIDCASLGNNHVLDWGYSGLRETLDTLDATGVRSAGAGRNLTEARTPATIRVPGRGRILVLGFGTESSGIPASWAATDERPGVNLLRDLSARTLDEVGGLVEGLKQPGDVLVASIHWGDNWGFEVPAAHVRFAHGLIRAGVDLVHGHSSHHVRPIEVVEGKLVLYGCGDFLDDYEGIGGYEEFRSDLRLMYFPDLEPGTGRLLGLAMTPMRMRRLRATRASRDDAGWLQETINRVSRPFGARVEGGADGRLALRLSGCPPSRPIVSSGA